MKDNLGRWTKTVVGVLEGLLVARLIGLLFAMRPDNPAFQIILAITAPFVWPWTWLDRWAAQPRFGARLELATLATMILIALVSLGWISYRTAKARTGTQSDGSA
jgi:hypothetical protein